MFYFRLIFTCNSGLYKLSTILLCLDLNMLSPLTPETDSNRRKRFCRPMPNHSAIRAYTILLPLFEKAYLLYRFSNCFFIPNRDGIFAWQHLSAFLGCSFFTKTCLFGLIFCSHPYNKPVTKVALTTNLFTILKLFIFNYFFSKAYTPKTWMFHTAVFGTFHPSGNPVTRAVAVIAQKGPSS